MNKYVIGIDLGINNVGWSIVDSEKKEIEKCGVRLFGESNNAQARREARSVRRRKKRKHNRIKSVLLLFGEISFPIVNSIDSELLKKRVLGLSQKLEKEDIVNISCYFASHRGYIPFGDEDRELIELDGLYPCEYYQNLLNKEGKYRALEQVVDNKDLMCEFNAIIDCQTAFYPELIDIKDRLIDVIVRKRKFWEGPGSKNSRTDYGRFKTQEYKDKHNMTDDLKFLYDDLIGRCSIYYEEKTVPVSNYYYEVFNLLNDFINTSIISTDNLIDQSAVEQDKKTGYYKLTTDSLNKIINYCKKHAHISGYNKIYKDLFGLKKEDLSGYRVNKDYKPEFSTMNFYRSILKAFEGYSTEWIEDIEQYNEIIRILAISPGIVETKKLITADNSRGTYQFNEEEYEILKNVSIKLKRSNAFKYGSLSEKALVRAIKDMTLTCKNYMQVSREFDYAKETREHFIQSYRESAGILLMDDSFINEIIASPQVKKSLRQAIKVINAIIVEKGTYPDVIAVESTHEMNGSDIRRKIEKEQKMNESARKDAELVLEKSFGTEYVTEINITKAMLFKELDGRCPYCGEPFKDGLNSIIKNNIEIEHILPISKSFNDSYSNKTLSCRSCNSSKSNLTPYLWMGVDRFLEFSERIKKLSISDEKKKNFLETSDLDKYNTRFFNRNLRDTAYATSELINQINVFNSFLDYKLKRISSIKTLSVPGQLTSKIRRNLKLEKNRDAGKFHHSVDASIVAGIALDDSIGSLLLESQNDKQFWIKKRYVGQRIGDMILGYNKSVVEDGLRRIKSDDDIKISVQVNKDSNKQIANANIYKFLKKADGYKKVEQISDIYSEDLMNNKTIPKLFDDGDETVTLMIKDNNPKMYNRLKQIYNEYVDRGSSRNPFVNYALEVNDILKDDFDYKIHGIKQENGPVIKKLRYYSSVTNPVLLNKDNINKKDNTFIGFDSVAQVYTKVYWDNDKERFIFLPIYITSIDLNSGKINKKDKTYQLFYNIYLSGKNYTFVVDLYNGNYIEFEDKMGNLMKGYVSYFHKTNNFIVLKDKSGFRTTNTKLIVYDVDYLGNKKERLTWPSK